jgi:hypothetical protein
MRDFESLCYQLRKSATVIGCTFMKLLEENIVAIDDSNDGS